MEALCEDALGMVRPDADGGGGAKALGAAFDGAEESVVGGEGGEGGGATVGGEVDGDALGSEPDDGGGAEEEAEEGLVGGELRVEPLEALGTGDILVHGGDVVGGGGGGGVEDRPGAHEGSELLATLRCEAPVGHELEGAAGGVEGAAGGVDGGLEGANTVGRGMAVDGGVELDGGGGDGGFGGIDVVLTARDIGGGGAGEVVVEGGAGDEEVARPDEARPLLYDAEGAGAALGAVEGVEFADEGRAGGAGEEVAGDGVGAVGGDGGGPGGDGVGAAVGDDGLNDAVVLRQGAGCLEVGEALGGAGDRY